MSGLTKDIRYALRQLRKAPGFSLTAILTLAFGIGATTAIFSIVEGVLLRPLPFADPSRLVILGDELKGAGVDALPYPAVSAPEVSVYQSATRSYSALGAYHTTYYELSGAGEPAQLNATRLSPEGFAALGVAPTLGRLFTAEEDRARQPLVVLSYATWRGRFHGDANVLGQKILLDRNPYQIIGVMPREFEFPLVPGQLNRSEFWTPLAMTPTELSNRGSWNYEMVGRLKPSVTEHQAQAEAIPAAQEAMQHFPSAMASLKIEPVVQRLDEATVASARPLVRTLFLAVTVVLFIACANLAGLLLVRVIRRRREFAVRLALGSGAGAIVRQGLIEALALSLSGGLLGLAGATVAIRVGLRFMPESLPRVDAIDLDWQVAVFAMLVAVATGLLCGLLPAIAASRTRINEGLKEGGRTGSSGGSQSRLRSALVIAEVAVALVLLVSSGLLLRSFERLRSVNLGIEAEHVQTGLYSLPHQEYTTQAAVDQFNDQLLRKLAAVPGVQAVGLTSQLPLANQVATNAFVAEGYVTPSGAGMDFSWSSQLVGSYLKAMGIPVVRGRDFTEADRFDSPLVIIVNRKLAEHYWPGQDPIGKRIHWGLKDMQTPWVTVVGEIGDIKQSSADSATMEQIYMPADQFTKALGSFAPEGMVTGDGGAIAMRGLLPAAQMADAMRTAVRSIDPRLPLTQVESMEQVVDEGQASRRFNVVVLSSFAGAAVLLAVMGIYSVIAFSAALRTQEMAIRLALGAQRASVMQMVLASGAKLGLAGCVIGVVAALFATKLLQSMLFEVSPLDPLVLGLAAFAIFALAIVASLVPARRVAQVEPVAALRGE